MEAVLDPEKEVCSPVDGNNDLEKGKVAEKAPVAVTDWNGPEDPDNPLNWPAWKRYFHIFPPAIIAFSAYVFTFHSHFVS